MRICTAWFLKHAATLAASPLYPWKLPAFMSGRCSLIRILRLPGRDFLALTQISTLTTAMLLGATAAKRALDNAQKLAPESPETLLALGWYQYWVLREYGLAEITFGRVSKLLPGSSEAAMALGRVTRRAGNWDQSIAYLEQALALDPRNVDSLVHAAETYIM